MKAALCLHGQPRFFEVAYNHTYSKIIDKYDCDVFIHTYWSESNIGDIYPTRVPDAFKKEDIEIKPDTIDRLIKIYNPKSIKYSWYDYNIISNHPSSYYQYYTQYEVKNMKVKYEQDNSFIYDMVFRTRFDYVFNYLDYDLDLDYLWVHATYGDPQPQIYNDMFSVSNSHNYNKACDTYLNIKEFESVGFGEYEYAFREQIKKENIPIKKIYTEADVLRSDLKALNL